MVTGVALTLGAQEKTVTNAAADDSSSEEVIIRRKPIPKPAVNQASSSSEEESEQVRAASLGLRVRAKVNYKEKGEKDIFKSDDEEMVSAPMQVILRDRSVAAVFDCLAPTIDRLHHSKSTLTVRFRRRRRRRSHTTATATGRRAAPASQLPKAVGAMMTTILGAPNPRVERAVVQTESIITTTTTTIVIG
jgi:hypothetical protein